jgi:hypothetical protein
MNTAWFYNFGRGAELLNRHGGGDKSIAMSVRCIKVLNRAGGGKVLWQKHPGGVLHSRTRRRGSARTELRSRRVSPGICRAGPRPWSPDVDPTPR